MKLILWIFLIAVACLTLITGDTPLASLIPDAMLRFTGESTRWNALLDERLPRLLILCLSGASLATAGAVMQSLFQSPLASPSVLGVSSGASLAVILTLSMGWHHIFPFIWPLSASLGAIVTLWIVYSLAKRSGRLEVPLLILSGIALSTLLMTFQAMALYFLRHEWHLVEMIREWEMGSTLNRTWQQFHLMAPLSLIGLVGCYSYRNELDLMSLGDEEAENLGVDVKMIRWRLFFCVALLTGSVIAAIGIVAFFGLVLPNLLRFLIGPSNKALIPYCLLFGATSLAGMDLSLRILNIQLLTIGNVSAIVGGVFFLGLLWKKRYGVAWS